MRNIDLFTGVGGFTLACQWNGIQTEVMVEKDEKCRRFLRQTYPDIPIIPDIRDFDGTKWQNRFILTAGVPCQPASRAGKQGGKEDDRWLWGEALRVVEEAKPCWCLFENPPGIYDVGLDGILSDLESIGYETGIVEIPACAVNSPQIRQRVWIVAHSKGNDDNGRPSEVQGQDEQQATERQKNRDAESCGSSQGDMADTTGILQERAKSKRNRGREPKTPIRDRMPNAWSNSVWLPCADGKLRRAPDNSFGVAHGLHRSLLAGLGNSIVWQVAYEIIKAIREVEI